MNFRDISLGIAESVDAWRIIPRTILVLYSTLVFQLYTWYRSIPTYVQEQCDAGVLRVLMDNGLTIEDARGIACSVLDVVGGPTAAQSAFVTTIVGLSTGIFGLYVATGRKWDTSNNNNNNNNNNSGQFPPIVGPQFPPQYNQNPNYNPNYGPPNNFTHPRGPSNDRRGPWGYGPKDEDNGTE